MDRRKVLISSGTAFATVLAGCSSINTSSEQETGASTDSVDKRNNEKDDDKAEEVQDDKKDDPKDEKDEMKQEKNDIPGFDRDDFQLDSDVLEVKDVTYRKQKLNVRVMLTTDDRDELVEGLRALAPGLARGVRDAEEFLAKLKEIKFTLLDEHKNRVFAFFLDVAWLREFLSGDMTNDEFVDRLLDGVEQL